MKPYNQPPTPQVASAPVRRDRFGNPALTAQDYERKIKQCEAEIENLPNKFDPKNPTHLAHIELMTKSIKKEIAIYNSKIYEINTTQGITPSKPWQDAKAQNT